MLQLHKQQLFLILQSKGLIQEAAALLMVVFSWCIADGTLHGSSRVYLPVDAVWGGCVAVTR